MQEMFHQWKNGISLPVSKSFLGTKELSVFISLNLLSHKGVLNRGSVSCPDTGPTLLQRPDLSVGEEGKDPLLESAPPLHDPVSSALGRVASQHSGPAAAESHCQQS
jgi:hypothetical protein